MRRFKINRFLVATAVLCGNIGLVRAFVLAEMSGEHNAFTLVFFISFVLQLGLWRYLTTSTRRRRFWLGFEVTGLAATLAWATVLGSDLELDNWYTGVASELAYFVLPTQVDVMLSTTHWGWFLAIIHFLPEVFAAALGGLLAACLFRTSEGHSAAIRPVL